MLKRRQVILSLSTVVTLAGCSSGEGATTQEPTDTQTETPTDSPTSTGTPTDKPTATEISPPENVLEYNYVDASDVSYTTEDGQYVKRVRNEVKVNNPCELSESEYLNIARDIIAKGTAELEINAATIFVWSESDVIGQSSAYIRIDWAPDGEWSKAHEVETGEYGPHEFAFKQLYRWDADC